MDVGDEPVKHFERTENRIDPAVIGDVIAEIMHRRRIERRDPDRVDAKPDEVIEPAPDSFEVADAVAV